MGYRMYVETEDEKELLCGGKLFGYVDSNLCESYNLLKGNCYFTNQQDQLLDLNYGNICEFRFSGNFIKEFLKLYVEDYRKLRLANYQWDFGHFDECIKNLNDDSIYILSWC